MKVKELTFEDVIWNIIPTNPVKSFTEGKVLQIIFFAVLPCHIQGEDETRL